MDRHRISCQEADELAGLYVLDALETSESAAVSSHLQECPEAHPLFAELASTSAELSADVEPLDTPPAMKDRVMVAIASTPQVPDMAAPTLAPVAPPDALVAPTEPSPTMASETPGAPPTETAPPITPGVPPTVGAPPTASGPPVAPEAPAVTSAPIPGVATEPRIVPSPGWLDRLRGRGGGERRDGSAWATLAAGALAVVLLAVGVVGALRLDAEEAGRLELLRAAVAAAASDQGNVAVLAGDAAADGAHGYAVFPDQGDGFIVIDGLDPPGTGKAYQAWYIADGVPASAGLLALGDDGLGTLTGLDPEAGTSVVAVTVEDAPGVKAPTSDPILAGELRTATASTGSRLPL